ncbi:MAG TPA: flippase [Patescibacteria group bacterium]|nr:flippase [Patescibacteria group bacterium]
MTLAQKIFQNTLIQTIGKAITIMIALIGFGLMTRYLGQKDFGYFSTIYAYLAIFGILVDLGLQMTTTKLIADPAENEKQILSNVLALRLTTSLIFLSLAFLVALFLPYPGVVKLGILIAIFGYTAAALTTVLTSFFQKHLVIHQAVIAEIGGQTLYLILMILAINLNLGLIGVLIASILNSVFIFIFSVYFVKRQLKINLGFDGRIWLKILQNTWPIGLTIALNLIYFKGDIFIMSLMRAPEEVGLYGAPYKILEVLINIVYLFLGLILPLLASAAALKDFGQIKKLVQRTFDFLIIITAPMIVGGYFLGEPLMVLMAGLDFVVSGEIIKILFIATGTIFIAGLFGYTIVAIGEQKKMIKFYAINAVISLIGYVIFISQYGYWGAAWMTVFTEAFILVSAAYVMSRKIKFLPDLKIFGKTILASAVMAIALYSWRPSFFVSLIIGAIIYFAVLYFLKGIDRNLILELVGGKNNEKPNH